MKNLFRNIFLISCLLLTVGAVEVNAQSNATELQTYLQQLEVDKVKYKNDPARYKEYENKIASIKAELGEQGASPNAANETKASGEQVAETEQARMARTLSSDDYAKWKVAQVPNSMKSTQQASTRLEYQRIEGQPVNEELYMGTLPEYRTFTGQTRTNYFPVAESEKNLPNAVFDLLANLLVKQKGIVKANFDESARHFVIQHNAEVLTTEVESIIKKVGNSDLFESELSKLNIGNISKSYKK